MSERLRKRIALTFYTIGAIGIIDFAVQMATNNEVRIIRAVLSEFISK